MTDPETLRDSTQIRLPWEQFDPVRETVESNFTVTVVDADGVARIIGSPVEIKHVNAFLTRNGIDIA
ncbi:hypothetical protein BRD20_10370 [Halobacteriales archaeon SW_8_65_20]|nr:MAG: hypothetical protein BRC71_09580 [Halobacteriales archaeon QH_7_65_31]PSQ31739.1 MAG: hypothetical protein BRD16_02175 [Halobacteriales archaeon SW_6_65_46]PSQ51648.1 MAG: hypothetical protein BRD20_10370 [Halobacteriales archaeon SW_8_65_20]